jgi:hypothetical protein
MSFSAEGWAWKQTCGSGPAKAVLVYIGWCADQDGMGFPSVENICARTEHEERTVRKAIKLLAEKRLLEVERRWWPNGRATSNAYRLPVATVDRPAAEPTPAKKQEPLAAESAPAFLQEPTPVFLQEQKGPTPAFLQEPLPLQNCPPTPAFLQENPVTVESKQESKEERLSRVARAGCEPPGFAEFYERYPKKVKRGKAVAAFRKATRIATPEAIMTGLIRQLPKLHRTASQYVPYPASWLNAESWSDEVEETLDDRLHRMAGLMPEPDAYEQPSQAVMAMVGDN